MTVKQELMEMVAQLPDDCTLEEAEYRFFLLRKIRESEEASAQGEVFSMEEARRRMTSWSKGR